MEAAGALMRVVVVGGEAVVGQALELLLGGGGHTVRYVSEHLSDEPGTLAGAGLLILTPGIAERRREGLISRAAGESPPAEKVPVLELVPFLLKAAFDRGRLLVPWPCRAEELERYVLRAVSADGGHEENGGGSASRAPEASGKEGVR